MELRKVDFCISQDRGCAYSVAMTSRPLALTLEALSDVARTRAAEQRVLTFENKGGSAFDPVTQLDRAIERDLRAYLLAEYPDDGVWGEEDGWSNLGAPRHWSIDPIDGTRALICGLPSWCILVGYLEGGKHLAGMIDCPPLGERLIAVDGATTRDGMAMSTSGCESLADARLSSTDPHLFRGDEESAFQAVREQALLTRYGLDALAYARVATGDIDLVVENGLKRHDLDALVPVVRGAGGYVGDWTGGDNWDEGRIVAAASRTLYNEAVAVLSR